MGGAVRSDARRRRAGANAGAPASSRRVRPRAARLRGYGGLHADALREALDALAPHLPRYRRAVEAYAAALDDDH